MEKRVYEYQGKSYLGLLTWKRMKSLFRVSFFLDKNELHISANPILGYEEVDKYVYESLPKLLRKSGRKKANDDAIPEGYTYILGELTPLDGLSEDQYLLKHKKEAMRYFESRTRKYEEIMKIKEPYRISLRLMKSRFGSNSPSTHRISYSLYLYRYAEEAIDSVVIHELCHDTHHNHGVLFNRKLRKYCPDYDKQRKRLIHHIYKKEESE